LILELWIKNHFYDFKFSFGEEETEEEKVSDDA
jgi:hypothetical protein